MSSHNRNNNHNSSNNKNSANNNNNNNNLFETPPPKKSSTISTRQQHRPASHPQHATPTFTPPQQQQQHPQPPAAVAAAALPQAQQQQQQQQPSSFELFQLPKILYLIRHAESQGQAAGRKGMDRRHDVRLRDCPLTDVGVQQAKTRITPTTLGIARMEQIELVVTSPLTRALQTALLAFPSTTPLMVHYELRELGSRVPENIPRNMNDVLQDLQHLLEPRRGRQRQRKAQQQQQQQEQEQHEEEEDDDDDDTAASFALLDVITTQPPDWPRDYSPRVCRQDKVRNALLWFARRPERHIAVVCHYNVIRALLFDDTTFLPTPNTRNHHHHHNNNHHHNPTGMMLPAPCTIRPQNAIPIRTELTRNDHGQVILKLAPQQHQHQHQQQPIIETTTTTDNHNNTTNNHNEHGTSTTT